MEYLQNNKNVVNIDRAFGRNAHKVFQQMKKTSLERAEAQGLELNANYNEGGHSELYIETADILFEGGIADMKLESMSATS